MIDLSIVIVNWNTQPSCSTFPTRFTEFCIATGLDRLFPKSPLFGKYHYQITSADESGNAASSTDLTFKTTGTSPFSIVSDDFTPDPDPSKTLKPTVKYDGEITDADVAPLYMRVKREGDQWTQSYGYDGVGWTTPVTFTRPLTVTKAGTYAGNAIGTSSPAHTAYIDYFFNTASPIVPEDGDALTVNAVGNGTVTKDPAPPYDCDDEVTLTASADPGWTFAGWSGDLSGTTNPITVTVTGSRVIAATFTQDEDTNQIFLPLITAQYSR